ncbi:MAG: PEGA domain-containing protein [Nitrospinae bacterium]|nr:PEGA domain-containing protein [Nitrospinota bacterium]
MSDIKRLGRYEIVKELGRGGMGIVLMGRDPHLDRMVALKIIKIDDSGDGMGNKELIERFYIEARAAGKINHPNIVTVYDVGEADGKKFIAMEFVEGRNLAEIISKEGPLTIPRAAKFIHQIADGLSYAHERGIVHRDIKPGNILVTGDDKAKISDFGLARLQSAGSVTQTGHAVGSPSYMSPEQVQGMAVDGRSDMFSLGVLFYEMLTQKRPFEGESLTTVIFKIIKDTPPGPSKLNKAVPQAFDDIIAKMTAKDPSYRYPTCADVAKAMLPFITDQSSFPLTTSDTVRTVSFTKEFVGAAGMGVDTPPKSRKASGKPIAALIAGLLLLVAAVVGGIMFFKPGSTPHETAAPKPAEVAKSESPQPPVTPVEVKKEEAPPPESAQQKPVAEEKPAPITEPSPASSLGTLTVITSPSGALVKVDGKERGKTPLTITDAQPGDRKVDIARQGHISVTKNVPVKAGQSAMLEIKLEARAAKVHVDAPEHATVSFDGKNVGTGPVTKEVAEGELKVTVEKEGFAAFTQNVTAKTGETVNVTARLHPLGKGTINVTAIPWANVFLNGKDVGSTPKMLKDIPEGKVDIKLSNPAYRQFATTVMVKADEQSEVSHAFTDAEEIAGGERGSGRAEEGGTGTLKISSTPPGIVYLDGKVYGRTPVTIADLPAGPHQLTLKRAGVPDYKRKVDISAGIITNVAVE